MSSSILFGCASAFVRILIGLPLWFYLLYQILSRVDASTPMWVAYWVYLPVDFLRIFLGALAEATDD